MLFLALLRSTEGTAPDTTEFQGTKTWLEQLPGGAFAQARQWSRAGAGLAILGFLLVVGGVIAIFVGYTVPGLVVALSGAVPETIVVFSLQQARKSEKQADEAMQKDLRAERLNRTVSLGDEALAREILLRELGLPAREPGHSSSTLSAPS